METKELSEILQEKAMETERKTIDAAIESFRRSLRLSGSSVIVMVEDSSTRDTVRVDSFAFFQALKIRLLEQREKSIKADAINDFLKKFESFQSHMLTIEQYAQNMVEGQ